MERLLLELLVFGLVGAVIVANWSDDVGS